MCIRVRSSVRKYAAHQDAFPPEQWNAKGLSSLRVGRYEGAIECFDKAIEILENSGKRKGYDLNSERMLVGAWRSRGIGFYEPDQIHRGYKMF